MTDSKSFIYGIHAVSAKLVMVDSTAVLYVDAKRQDTRIRDCIELAKNKNCKVIKLDKRTLDKKVNGKHQGLILQLQDKIKTYHEKDLSAFLASLNKPMLLLILDGVTDPHNLGACLRVANGVGVDAVIVPKDKSASLTPTAIKVASGAAENTRFFQVTNLARVLKKLADDGVWLVATDDQAHEDIYTVDFKVDTAVILGSEGSGVRKLTKKHCQQLVSIPMLGAVSSLNVSTAGAAILYEALRQRLKCS